MTQAIRSVLRVRLGHEDAHYGGNLVDGARILRIFGDVITEIAIRTDGDEGLFSGYCEITFLAPVYAGDFVEATGVVTRQSRLRRTVEFEARKVIAARPGLGPSRAEALSDPIPVCRARGATVVPAASYWKKSRRHAEGLAS